MLIYELFDFLDFGNNNSSLDFINDLFWDNC